VLLFFEREALVGCQGRGCAEVVQALACYPFLLAALLVQCGLKPTVSLT